MSRWFFLGLIIGNLLWSAHPIMGKILLNAYTPGEAAWLRYSSAGLAFFIAMAIYLARSFLIHKKKPFLLADLGPFKAKDAAILIVVGLMNFCLAPWLQLTGLAASEASDNALIVALEPLLTVVLARIFLGDILTKRDLIGIVLALAGFFVLSGPQSLENLSLKFLGNLALLFSLLGESTFSVGSAKLIGLGRRPVWILGFCLSIGVAILSFLLYFNNQIDFGTIVERMSPQHFFAMIWLGPVGTTLSYLFWIYALERLSIASVVLSLFIQPVFGSILASYYLNETLGPEIYVGGLLILSALALSALQKRQSH